MSGTSTPIFPQTIKNYVAQIQNSDGTTLKTLVTGGTNGTKIESINVSLTDTSDTIINVYMTVSAVNYLLTTILIPLSSGNSNTVPSVNLLNNAQFPSMAFDNNGNKYLYVANGSTLKVATTTTLASSTFMYFLAQGGDF